MPHIHKKIDFTVEVFIVHNDKVLLRKHDKYKIWLSVGGHIELDEDPIQAAIREAKEEVGLDIVIDEEGLDYNQKSNDQRELVPPRFLNRHRINENHEHVCLVYFAKSESSDISNQADEQSEEIRWFSLEELDDPSITNQIRHYAKRALLETA